MSEERISVLLMVRDSAEGRQMAEWLSSTGYEVREASGSKQAIESVVEICPHMVIVDGELLPDDLDDFCRWLRKQSLPHYLYSLFLACRRPAVDSMCEFAAGADAIIYKPVGKAEFISRIRAGQRILDLEIRLRQLAKSDPLTGLATQPALYEHMEREWGRANRYRLSLSCAMVDIDFFKRINDTIGHLAGDEILRQLAALLTESCRSSDIVSRYGGEEFCVLLPETDEAGAVAWAERVRSRIAGTNFNVGGEDVRVTASVGVAQRPDDTCTPEELVDLADQALLVAKRSGRDRVVNFQSIRSASQGRRTDEFPRSRFGLR